MFDFSDLNFLYLLAKAGIALVSCVIIGLVIYRWKKSQNSVDKLISHG